MLNNQSLLKLAPKLQSKTKQNRGKVPGPGESCPSHAHLWSQLKGLPESDAHAHKYHALTHTHSAAFIKAGCVSFNCSLNAKSA